MAYRASGLPRASPRITSARPFAAMVPATRSPSASDHFGTTVGSPPGDPGGGMIGVLPAPSDGTGRWISVSPVGGGVTMPRDSDSLSDRSGSAEVEPDLPS